MGNGNDDTLLMTVLGQHGLHMTPTIIGPFILTICMPQTIFTMVSELFGTVYCEVAAFLFSPWVRRRRQGLYKMGNSLRWNPYDLCIAHHRCTLFLNPQVLIDLTNWILWFKLTRFVSLPSSQQILAIWNHKWTINRINRQRPLWNSSNIVSPSVWAAPNFCCHWPPHLYRLHYICYFYGSGRSIWRYLFWCGGGFIVY